MNSIKSIFPLVAFLCSAVVWCQQIIMVDTLTGNDKKELIQLYNGRVAAQKLAFEKAISDKNIRKEVNDTYRELSSKFVESINEGVFAQSKVYNDFFEGILSGIRANNPQFPDIANTKILLSFGASPNAYAVGNDIIVVLVPLISHLNNEHELAFIISHEIAHNLLRHSYTGMIEYATITQSEEVRAQTRQIEKQKYNKAKSASGLYRDIIYGKRRNIRQFELQADSLGFVIFKNAYKGREYEALRSLETLDEVDKERDSLTASDYFALFNSDQLPFNAEWIAADELASYKYDSTPKFWETDSLKTHPDCRLRAGAVQKHFMVKPAGITGPSETFTLLKKSSRYNHIFGLFVIEEYGKSLYETLLLLKDDRENIFLRRMVADNLKKLQGAQKTYTLNKYLESPNPKFSGSYNTFLSFVRQLRKSEISQIINQYSTNQ